MNSATQNDTYRIGPHVLTRQEVIEDFASERTGSAPTERDIKKLRQLLRNPSEADIEQLKELMKNA